MKYKEDCHFFNNNSKPICTALKSFYNKGGCEECVFYQTDDEFYKNDKRIAKLKKRISELQK